MASRSIALEGRTGEGCVWQMHTIHKSAWGREEATACFRIVRISLVVRAGMRVAQDDNWETIMYDADWNSAFDALKPEWSVSNQR